MKKVFTIFWFLLAVTTATAQEGLKAYFKSSNTIIKSGPEVEVTDSVEVLVPKQPKYKGAIIEVYVENNPMSPNPALIFLQEGKVIKVSDEEDVTKTIKFKFPRNSKDDRLLLLKLKAFDEKGLPIKLDSPLTIYNVYIKPLQKEISDEDKHGYQLWFYTGTNFDLLDGIKAKDLYFKGSYYLNIRKNSVETKSWLNITFGKNRYFSVLDSVNEIPFQQRILNPNPADSVRIINGYYNTVVKTTTENVFASLDYLYNIKEISNKNSRVFLNAGIYVGLQEIRNSYKNTITLSDTISFPISNAPERINSAAREMKFRRVNKNISIGFTHILSTTKIDVKTKFSSGINFHTFPRRIVKSGLNTQEYFEGEKNVFFMFNTEATVLNPGISIGFEAFIRENNFPLYNFHLTKVLTLEKLANIFSPVSSFGSK